MITIEGFSPLERQLADHLWALDTVEDVETFIQTLPKSMRRPASVVRDMLVAAALDENCGELDLAKSVLDSMK